MIAAKTLGLAGAGPRDVAPGGRDDAAEHGAAPGDFEELIDRVVAAVVAALPLHVDGHQPVGIVVRERVQDYGVEHAVHGGAAADAERQRADRDDREGGRVRQVTRADAEIAGKLREEQKGLQSCFLQCTDVRIPVWFTIAG